MVEVPDRHGARSLGEARFLSRVERALGDAFEPLGLRVDRWIGVRVGEERLQPTFRTFRGAPACEFAVAFPGDWLDVAFARAADSRNILRPLPYDVIALMGASIAASASRR